MSLHQRILPGLLEVCTAIHPECGVVLIGSVAQGTEHPWSDLDLNLILPGGERPGSKHPYVSDDNRWQSHTGGTSITQTCENSTSVIMPKASGGNETRGACAA